MCRSLRWGSCGIAISIKAYPERLAWTLFGMCCVPSCRSRDRCCWRCLCTGVRQARPRFRGDGADLDFCGGAGTLQPHRWTSAAQHGRQGPPGLPVTPSRTVRTSITPSPTLPPPSISPHCAVSWPRRTASPRVIRGGCPFSQTPASSPPSPTRHVPQHLRGDPTPALCLLRISASGLLGRSLK